MNEKILLVDDESAILEGYQRLLHRDFKTDVAVGGTAALTLMQVHGPYAVVVSDMRMPKMDGAQFLSKVKAAYPDTIRVLLTGYSDMQTAVSAVNEGNIFRFLTKPCTKETIAKTLTASLLQYRLITAEKELLEKTLKGSVQVLTDVMSLVNPAAFGRAMRVRRYIQHMVKKMGISNPWRFEIAAMLSQLGCVTLSPEMIETAAAGGQLSAEDRLRYEAHPSIACELIKNIPRLEPIAWMIAHQNDTPPLEGDLADREMADMRMGAEMLHAALEFDELLRKLGSKTEALHRLRRQQAGVDLRILEALLDVEPEAGDLVVRVCSIDELSTGMILREDIRATGGSLIASQGHEITLPLLLKLKDFCARGAVGKTFTVSLPNNLAAGATA